MLAVRGKTRQHCCAPRGHKKCFRNIFCVQDKKFVSATNVARVAKRVNIWETWSRQQCCRHNVSSFCQPLIAVVSRQLNNMAPTLNNILYYISADSSFGGDSAFLPWCQTQPEQWGIIISLTLTREDVWTWREILRYAQHYKYTQERLHIHLTLWFSA